MENGWVALAHLEQGLLAGEAAIFGIPDVLKPLQLADKKKAGPLLARP